jgi:hypothetical protein
MESLIAATLPARLAANVLTRALAQTLISGAVCRRRTDSRNR